MTFQCENLKDFIGADYGESLKGRWLALSSYLLHYYTNTLIYIENREREIERERICAPALSLSRNPGVSISVIFKCYRCRGRMFLILKRKRRAPSNALHHQLQCKKAPGLSGGLK